MGQKFTLGKKERLKSRKAIEMLFREGKSFAVFPFRVYYMQTGKGIQQPLQAGFGASSRNFKNAVDRNRIKRLTREAYRLLKGSLQDKLQETGRTVILFIIYTGKEIPEYHSLSQKMEIILKRLVKEAEL